MPGTVTITDKSAYTTPIPNDYLLIRDVTANVDKKVTVGNLGLAITGAYTAYTPVWSSSGTAPAIGNGTITGAYTQIGKRVEVRIYVTFGSTTTFGSGNFYFSLPVTARAINSTNAEHVSMQVGTGTIVDAGNNYYPASPRLVDTSKIEVGITTTLGGTNPVYVQTSNAMTASAPFTMGSTDGVYLTLSYEAA